ncbi:hypothetical protein BD560DRAFT_481892 [Blakeslea trispora]|nr:hypothetical protein BD560DRAFT_481892 [Blakeslea trispora]
MAKKKDTPSSKESAPKVVLRTYRESDYEEVEYLFRATQIPLVYESIRSKIWAPLTWVIWFIGYSAILYTIPFVTDRILGKDIPLWAMTTIKVFSTFWWGVLAFVTLFVTSDRVEMQNRVDEAMANDLSDPDLYYLNYTVQDGKKVRKPEEEQVPSHFWVLSVDDKICGFLGLSCYAEDKEDQRETLPVEWKQFLVALLELLRLPVPALLEKGRPNTSDYQIKDKKRIFAHQQLPRTATITRWAIRSDLQACGLSTLLMNRAITWCKEREINRVYALVNESNMAAEQVLMRRHGFVMVKKFKKGLFGQFEKLLACRVNEWMNKHGEQTRKAFKKSE